jgi:tetratricopeptide (TPR) repeat protein
MIELTPFPGQPVLQVLRQLYLARESARLQVQHAGGKQMFRVASGELQLRSDDPLAARLRAAAERERPALLLDTIERWSEPQVKVARGAVEEDPAWAAHSPTSTLLLMAAIRGRDDRRLLEILGGEGTRLEAAASEEEMMRLPGIEPEDAFLFSRLASPVGVGEMIAQSSLPRAETLARLCRLRAVGLIAPPGGAKAEADDNSAAPKLVQRIAEDLALRPVRMMAGEHRDRIGALLGRFGGLDHYELLGVSPGATDDEVHRGFVELARLVHPSHAVRLQLAGGAAVLTLLFERAVDAYLTLCDPQKRVAYNDANGITGVRSTKTPAELQTERVRAARRSFDLAAEMSLAEDYHFAVELLKQAVAGDPRPEYFALLAACQAKNENWLAQAAESAREALARKPNDPGYHCLLGRILEESGDGPGAIAAYNAALAHMSEHPEARSGLERLAVARREAVEADGGTLLHKLRGLFRPRT